MMKTSHDGRFRRPIGSRIPLRAAAAFAAAAGLFALVFFFRTPVAGVLTRGAAPLSGARAGGFFAQFSSNAALAAQNADLRSELLRAQAELADRDALYAENILLKKEYGRSDTAHAAVLAGVVARPPAVPYDTLLIDAGSAQGVAAGLLVSAGGGAVIGKVEEAYPATSRVALFSSPGASYQALLNGSIPLSMEGRGGGSFSGKVPAATAAAVGDLLALQGIAGGFAGRVSSIETSEGNSFKTLYFSLPVNYFELRYVEVWKQ